MLPPSIVRLVQDHPTTPRSVDARALLREIFQNSSVGAVMSFGVIVAALGLALAIWKLGATSDADARLGFAFIAFGSFVAGVPLILWRRVLLAARMGPLGTAVVSAVAYHDASRDTLDAVENGMARGTWIVRAGTREFHEEFENDSRWASQIRVGTRVLVLVHPTKDATMFAVAPDAA